MTVQESQVSSTWATSILQEDSVFRDFLHYSTLFKNIEEFRLGGCSHPADS